MKKHDGTEYLNPPHSKVFGSVYDKDKLTNEEKQRLGIKDIEVKVYDSKTKPKRKKKPEKTLEELLEEFMTALPDEQRRLIEEKAKERHG